MASDRKITWDNNALYNLQALLDFKQLPLAKFRSLRPDQKTAKNTFLLLLKARVDGPNRISCPELSQIPWTGEARIIVCIDFEQAGPIEGGLETFVAQLEEGREYVIYNLPLAAASQLDEDVAEKNISIYAFQSGPAGRSYQLLSKKEGSYLDLLLMGPQALSIFEHNALHQLQSELKTDHSEVKGKDKISGFKIPESHFRLGSKIHISNFYFAKRLFQNNYFASRFAFLLLKEITEKHFKAPLTRQRVFGEPAEGKKGEGLTLIGYGLYSELLLSTVEHLLATHYRTEKINHDLFSDEENLKRIKPKDKIHPNVIMIIPISSTFSTSVKIEEEIMLQEPNTLVLEPHLNVVNVFDNSERAENGLTKNEQKFGWESISIPEKTVTIKTLTAEDKNQTKDQRYFLQLPTTWHDIQDCELCFNSNASSERPLFITDKTSITPLLIFGLPEGRKLGKHRAKFKLSPEMVRYGHYLSDNSHYLYYIEKQIFFKENKHNIDKWLKKIKEKDRFPLNGQQRYVIIATGNYSNAGFVNAVNDIIFNSSATVIHYDPSQDHIQNFQAFYSDVINGTEHFAPTAQQWLQEHKEGKEEKDKQKESGSPRIIFVDDTLLAGTNFRKSNYFVKHTRKNGKGFDDCILMLDRSSRLVYENLVRKLTNKAKGYQAFANLHLPRINELDSSCPLCKERERYLKLAQSAYLDKIKVHFLNKANKLAIKESSEVPGKGNPKYIRKIEAIHRVYEWFSFSGRHPSIPAFESFERISDWKDSILELTAEPFKKSGLKDTPEELIEETILKILTHSPLMHYKTIKEQAFRWVIQLLIEQTEKVSREIRGQGLSEVSLRRLKFLIRRAGLLNANYLISEDFLKILKLLLSAKGRESMERWNQAALGRVRAQRKQQPPENLNHHLNTLERFAVFYVAQVKELLFLNEARSIKLEENLLKVASQGTMDPAFAQLIRILREENGILLENFLEFITKDKEWTTLAQKSDKYPATVGFLQKKNITRHYRYKTLSSFLEVASPQTSQNSNPTSGFQKYVYLLNLLDPNLRKQEDRSEKTRETVQALQSLVVPGRGPKGLFFAVKYNSSDSNNVYFAYNKGSHGSIEEFNEGERDNYFLDFLNGTDDKSKSSKLTIDELHRTKGQDKKSYWKNLYSLKDATVGEEVFGQQPIPDEYNRLLLLRINRRGHDSDIPQGMVCFYFSQEATVPTEINTIRYLLVLRPMLSKFIEDHHENNEFSDWLKANAKRRTALLTGHGRDMLMRIASRPAYSKRYQPILLTILITQHFFIDMQDFTLLNGPEEHAQEFMRFFNFQDNQIDEGYLKETIVSMGKEIFHMAEVENQDDVSVKLEPGSPKFSFPKSLLESIFFELFVNAKKNRYIFKGRTISSEKNKGSYDQNRVKIKVQATKEEILIEVSNTCTKVDGRVLSGINNIKGVQNGKYTKDIAGVELVSTILKKFDLGRIEFHQDHTDLINEEKALYNFRVKMYLKVKRHAKS